MNINSNAQVDEDQPIFYGLVMIRHLALFADTVICLVVVKLRIAPVIPVSFCEELVWDPVSTTQVLENIDRRLFPTHCSSCKSFRETDGNRSRGNATLC